MQDKHLLAYLSNGLGLRSVGLSIYGKNFSCYYISSAEVESLFDMWHFYYQN